ncbi:Response regulator receiver domain-containing protein [Devosia sp. YR412]|uniref:hybrid sensor histidine kinase/response regulator n=1 Tax=Devosia sp. YR412 TaxID=1881030 RepID=UPI0008AF5EDB|nr:response regulator [Devosia sp. YR412]SEP81040.1 Response regulator receiver domain-containing protein [Devosia sp. YR412]
MSDLHTTIWPVKGGSTGELVRTFDWASTSLGPRDSWGGHLRATVDNLVNSPVPKVLMWGPDHIMIYNDGYIDIAGGYHPKALGGAVPHIWPEIWDWNRKILETGFRGEVQGFQDQSMVLRRNGREEEVFFDLFYTPIRIENGDVGGVLCTVIENTERVAAERRLAEHADALERQIAHRKRAELQLQQLNETLESRIANAIAERRLAEQALVQSQKMETIGKLTGGVAHDFNNLLQVISGNLQLVAKDVAGNDKSSQRVVNAMSAVDRGAKLASQLLAFGRRQALEPKIVKIDRLVRDMDDMLRRAIGEEIEIETVVGGGLWNTLIDPAQLENALLNLAINARDAMAGTGKLTIELGNASLDDDYARAHNEVTAGQYVLLAVTDTGSGIPQNILEKVFDPFFSTKSEGKGSGLGLSMVYGFVKQSGGHVKIYSEVGEGTTIKLYLPRSVEAEDVRVILDAATIQGGSETILVVEDDADVRATVVELLTDLGYRVLKAIDAQSGLNVIESGVPIDLLFTDVVMPGTLKSAELARKARERMPHIAVLFTSGYTENSIVHGGRLDAGVNLLSKPYTREALARKVRLVLANQSQINNATQGHPQTSQGSASSVPGKQKPLRILLVDDEMLIRMNTADILQDLGHTVLDAGSGKEALDLLTSEIDVLLTDVHMAGMSGLELATAAKSQVPTIAVVFATGDNDVTGYVPGPNEQFAILPKPYTQADITKVLQQVTSRPQE